jgi:Domain of unknown function (DUF4226)
VSDWDVIGSVVGTMIGTVLAGPVGGIAGFVGGGLLGADHAPQHVPWGEKPPPYPGTVPEIPPYPPMPGAPAPRGPGGAPPASPPGPPPADPNGQGKAAEAGSSDSAQIAQAIEDLSQLDKQSADAVAAIEAAGEAGRQALRDIAASVDAKITELGPRLNTPHGQQELRDFLKDRLTAAKQVLDEANQKALDKAREIHAIADRYHDIGKPTNGTGPYPDSDAGPSSGGSGARGRSSPDGSTRPASSTDEAGAPPPGAPQSGAAQAGLPPGMGPMMPGMGMMPPMGGMPMPSMPMPSFGGSPMPIGDPLSALSGLGDGVGPKVLDPGVDHGDDPDGGDSKVTHTGADGDSPSGHDPIAAGDKPTGDATQPTDATTPAADHHGGVDPAAEVPAAATGQGNDMPTDVTLPDGSTAHAPSPQAATALRAALNGASVSDAYQQAGITLPPAGSPVLDPVPPGHLQPGDVGVWKDHMVMALGDSKVLVSGQVQPQSSMGSGPDFLGWMDPTKPQQPGGQPGSSSSPPSPPGQSAGQPPGGPASPPPAGT